MTPFVARVSRWRIGVGIAGCLGFVALGGVIVRVADSAAGHAIGLLAIVTFLAFAAIGIARVGRGGEALRIDRDGIALRDRPRVPWDAIVHAKLVTMHGQRFLCLWLDRPERFAAERGPGLGARTSKLLGFGDVALGVQGTDARFTDLLAAFRHFGGAMRIQIAEPPRPL